MAGACRSAPRTRHSGAKGQEKPEQGMCPQKGAGHPSSTLLKLSRAPEEGAEVAAVGAEHAGGREELKMNF